MTDRLSDAQRVRPILKLARENRAAARSQMADLSLDEQVAAVCEAPMAWRNRILELCPEPETIVPLLPEAELCFTCKELGIDDSSWLLEHATEAQIIACLDLDVWKGLVPDRADLDRWFAALAEAGDPTLIRAARSMDTEILALYLRAHVAVDLKPSGDDDWQPPEGGQTLDGQFYYIARKPNEDLAVLTRLLRVLFESDYWLYFRILQSVEEEQQVELEEWALRWRTGRLEDLGFPSWDRSMRIYGYLRSDRLSDLPPESQSIESSEWPLPIWITDLPAAADHRLSVFKAVAELAPEERARFFYSFINLANQVAVADRSDLADAETLPKAIEKAAQISSLGLEHLAKENALSLSEGLRRIDLQHLFRVGVHLSPEEVRPSPHPSELEEVSSEPAEPEVES
ncbi:DUF6178 family protein [Myxococcota bacterium]|nr:DUF6178 family protein [Myxococcota bacterium]